MAANESKTEVSTTFIDHSGFSVSLQGVTQTSDTIEGCEVCNDIKSLPREIVIVQLVFPAFTLIANSTTALAIYRAHSLKSTLRMSLLNLSFTDILASLLYIYHIAFSWTSFEINVECIVRYALYVASIVLTMETIEFISLDRFLSIFLPFKYNKLNGYRYYVHVAIGVTWIITAVTVITGFAMFRSDAEGCFYPLLMTPEIHLFYGIAGLVVFTSIIVFNSLIYGYTRIHIARIAATLVGDQRQHQIRRLESKANLTTVSIVVPYILMNFPIYILMLYFYLDEDYTKTMGALLTVNGLSSLSLGNSLINPTIYIWRSGEIREELMKLGSQFVSLFLRCKNCSSKKTKTPDQESAECASENTRNTPVNCDHHTV